MKTWKLVSGILSIVFFFIVCFQSCGTGIVNAIDGNNADTSGAAGMILAFCLLVAGIVSLATRSGKGNGGNICLIIFYGFGALIGFVNLGTFGDLVVWSWWSTICAALAVLSIVLNKKNKNKNPMGAGIAIIMAATTGLGMISCGGTSEGNAEKAESAKTEQAEAPIEYIDCKAGDLLKEQQDNSARAKKTYEDHYLSVEGVVNQIGDNGNYFEIDGGEDFSVNSIKCNCRTDELKNQILELNKGQKVTVKGKCTDVSGGFRTYAIDVTEIVK